MFYDPRTETSGLPYNPFKSCCVPRPIGWMATVSKAGVHNLAPFSQFQNLTWDPPTVMIAANNRPDGTLKDTTANILETGEFVWNMATWEQRALMFGSAHDFASEVDEFAAIGIEHLPSRSVAPRRVAGSPVQFECVLTQKMPFPGNTPEAGGWILVGQVVGIHIADGALRADGILDVPRLKPLARLGYRDYTCVDQAFDMTEFDGRAMADSAHNLERRRG
jgi:flavin reductase (DIM6/NTAB) family NADH-FMN oxidoreductase RutF